MQRYETDKYLNLEINQNIYSNNLDLEGFSSMLNSPSFCYKFYWLEALVKLISEDITEMTFGDVIDEMIANAWYSVVEFHIHLSGMVEGRFRDGLENAVVLLKETSGLETNASKIEIKKAIKEHESELKQYRVQLTKMVPYRALSGFFIGETEKANWNSTERLIAYIEKVNKHKLLPYTLGKESGLNRKVIVNPIWKEVIQDNTVQILGWIQYEKVKWLQNNNPEVPSIVYKLQPLENMSRKLTRVHNLWDAILEKRQIMDVFTKKPVDDNKYDVDHFIPWSFVMNDELWNLMPMDSGLNSKKNNQLPIWDKFFVDFANNQFIMYQEIHDSEKMYKLYEKCYKDNIHSIWAAQELYKKGNDKDKFMHILESNMRPVYDSARRQGYQVWNKL